MPIKPKKERSSRDDWLREALNLLGEKGLKSITFESLCKRLKLTKGSFYWHFKGRAELLSGMAERYATSHHDEFYKSFERRGLNDHEQLEELAKETFNRIGRIDHAMRLWAETSEKTRTAVLKSDKKNLAFLEERLKNIGLPVEKVELFSRLQYALAVGLYSTRMLIDEKESSAILELTKQLTLMFVEEEETDPRPP
jgi:AcrR family transcriptional regulator